MTKNSGYLPFSASADQAIRLDIAYFSTSLETTSPVGTLAGLITKAGVVRSSASLASLLHEGYASSHAMTPIKGTLTEAVMERFIIKGFLQETGRWIPGTPARVANTGIDGLFFRTDRVGNLRAMLVAEAKYGTSHLGKTISGRQMDPSWTNQRLGRTAREYTKLTEELRRKTVVRASAFARWRADKVMSIPLKDGGVAEVWATQREVINVYSAKLITAAEIETQARRVALYTRAAAEGRLDYRSRVFRYRTAGKEHRITLEALDPKNGRPVTVRTIQGRYDDLPEPIRKTLYREFDRVFRSMGKSSTEACEMAKHACEDPEYFRTMTRDPHWNRRAGLDWQAARTAAVAGLVALALDVVFQFWASETIDWKRSAWVGGLGGVSGFVGHYGGVQLNSLLSGTRIGQNILSSIPLRTVAGTPIPSLLASAGGGVLAGAVFAYGFYLLGYSDLQGANRQMLAGGAGVSSAVSASAGTLALVTAYGTASTGTPIASLSGAAATKAALAWLGGGPVAAGGGGVALGSTVLTAGAAAVGIGIGVGIGYLFRVLDEKERRTVLEGRLQIIAQRVQKGIQPEWSDAVRNLPVTYPL